MEDGAHLSHLKDFEASLILHLLVGVFVECEILHGAHAVGVLEATTELAQHFIAGVQNELDVGLSAFLTEKEDEAIVEAEPVKEHDSGADQLHVLVFALFCGIFEELIIFILICCSSLVSVVVVPANFKDANQQVHAAL